MVRLDFLPEVGILLQWINTASNFLVVNLRVLKSHTTQVSRPLGPRLEHQKKVWTGWRRNFKRIQKVVPLPQIARFGHFVPNNCTPLCFVLVCCCCCWFFFLFFVFFKVEVTPPAPLRERPLKAKGFQTVKIEQPNSTTLVLSGDATQQQQR